MTATPLSVTAPNPSAMTLEGTNTYIVGDERCVIIDPGPDLTVHVDAVAEAVGDREVTAIVATHLHPDHVGAGPQLALRLDAPLRVPGKGADWIDGAQPIRDGARLETDRGDVVAVAAPGHAPEHIVLRWEQGDGSAIFVGDLLLGSGDTALVASPEGDVGDYFRSLARIEGMSPTVLYPAHGPALANPSVALQRFRDHRMKRVEQVRWALQRSPDISVERLVGAIYGPDLPAELHEAAVGSIQAIRNFLDTAG